MRNIPKTDQKKDLTSSNNIANIKIYIVY